MVALAETAKITTRRALLPIVRLPKIHIGQALIHLADAYGRALEMTYVKPYQISQQRSAAVSEETSDGRDPRW